MNEETKLLTDSGLIQYDGLLKTYGLALVEIIKAKTMSITYNEGSRIMEFSIGAKQETFIITDDGSGNVTMDIPSTSTLSDDGLGNVTLTNATFTEVGGGKIILS